MIALVSTEQKARVLANVIHAERQTRRPGYRADIWADPMAHPDNGQWAVPLPPEWGELGVDSGDSDMVDALPEDWVAGEGDGV